MANKISLKDYPHGRCITFSCPIRFSSCMGPGRADRASSRTGYESRDWEQYMRDPLSDRRVTRAARQLRELKAEGVELHEILSGQAGRTFIRDYCEGDPELVCAAFVLAYNPNSIQEDLGQKVRKQEEAEVRKQST